MSGFGVNRLPKCCLKNSCDGRGSLANDLSSNGGASQLRSGFDSGGYGKRKSGSGDGAGRCDWR